MKYVIFSLTIFSSLFAISQHANFNTQKNWSLNKKEILFGIGATQFTGDVGGSDGIGKDYSLRDLDLRATRFSGLIGFRYRFAPMWSTTTVLNFGMLAGDDAYTEDIVRKSRNLHFRSWVVELNQRIEFIVYSNEGFVSSKNNSKARNKNERVYLFSGIGINYFYSQARYNNEWVGLRELKTEGQGIAGGPSEYLPITATIPMGIGFRTALGRMWSIGIEASYVKTFSDYIDDVHGVYYDPANLGSPAAQYLSNPAQVNAEWFNPGSKRGDSQNDSYYYLNFVVSKNITYKDNKRNSGGIIKGRYKF
jgi:hypothetical protein